MKILLLNTSDNKGGAAIAAKRLYQSLNKSGWHTDMLILDQTPDKGIISLSDTKGKVFINKLRFLWERFVIYINNKFSRKWLFKVSIANTGNDISRNKLVKEADIIHLHWVNNGFLSLKDIGKLLLLNKPVVWTLHDLWPATGICHHPDKCLKYQTACHTCPQLVKHPWVDLANIIYKRKQQMLFTSVHFIGCSEWITQKASESGLLKNSSFDTIPNPIDTDLFSPADKNEARKRLNLPLEKQLIIFTAANIQDEWKGFSYLSEACYMLTEKYSLQPELILIGKGSDELSENLPFNIHSLGYISDITQIKDAYCAADILVIPSVVENLPNTIMEGLACGLPCCGFDTGGIPEMIDHKQNGYIAKLKDASDLATGIQWVLSNPDKAGLSRAAREKVEKNYNQRYIADKYISLYKKLLHE